MSSVRTSLHSQDVNLTSQVALVFVLPKQSFRCIMFSIDLILIKYSYRIELWYLSDRSADLLYSDIFELRQSLSHVVDVGEAEIVSASFKPTYYCDHEISVGDIGCLKILNVSGCWFESVLTERCTWGQIEPWLWSYDQQKRCWIEMLDSATFLLRTWCDK